MSTLRCTLALTLLLATLATTACRGTENESAAWQAQVARISAGSDNAARAAAIVQALEASDLAWRKEDFVVDGKAGTNLVADVPGSSELPLLLLGAHYDRVATGHGATDNASGVATVLALAKALQERPLAGHRVQVVFWDLEEEGLLGARHWVDTPARARPALYVNFDVFGWGDTLWMMAPTPGEPLEQALSRLAQDSGFGFHAGPRYPPSDHLAFLKQGWPAVSFSLVGGDEIDPILQVFGGGKPDPTPKVMQVIHSAGDTLEALDATSVPAALALLEDGLRHWDASLAP